MILQMLLSAENQLYADLDEDSIEDAVEAKERANKQLENEEDEPIKPDLGMETTSDKTSEPNRKIQPKATVPKTKQKTKKNGAKGPVKWKSQGLLATQEKGVIELEKDVEITQDDLVLRAQHSKIYFSEDGAGEVDKVHLDGKVHIERKTQNPADEVVAKANRATYYSADNKVYLEGNARLWRSGNLIKGKKITYDLQSGWITVDRVEGVVQPKNK